MASIRVRDILEVWLRDLLKDLPAQIKYEPGDATQENTDWTLDVYVDGELIANVDGYEPAMGIWVIKVVIGKGPMWDIFLSGGRFDLVVNPANPADLDRGEKRIRDHLGKYA